GPVGFRNRGAYRFGIDRSNDDRRDILHDEIRNLILLLADVEIAGGEYDLVAVGFGLLLDGVAEVAEEGIGQGQKRNADDRLIRLRVTVFLATPDHQGRKQKDREYSCAHSAPRFPVVR